MEDDGRSLSSKGCWNTSKLLQHVLTNVDLIQTCQARDSETSTATTRHISAGWRPSCGQWWKDGAILENTGRRAWGIQPTSGKRQKTGWWQLKLFLFPPLFGEDCHFD